MSPDMEWKAVLHGGFLGALAWNLAWLVLCVVFIFRPELLLVQMGVSRTTLSILLRALLFGGVGSIVGFFYDFARCIIKKSPVLLVIHKPYFAKPFKGMLAGTLMGGLAYAMWHAWDLLLAPFIGAGHNAIGVETSVAVLYFMALGCGNREYVFFDMVGRLLKKFLMGGTVGKEDGDAG